MKLGRRAIVLWVWVLVATAGGVGLIMLGQRLLSMIGVVAIILGLISLMPALMYTLEDGEESPYEDERPA